MNEITAENILEDIKILANLDETTIYDPELILILKGKMQKAAYEGVRVPYEDEEKFIDLYKLALSYAIRIDLDLGNPELLKILYLETLGTAKIALYSEVV